MPTVAHALSSGQVLAITDAEIRQAFLACIDTITETPEPYEQAWQARDAQSDAFRVDPAVFQDVFGVDLVKALAAVQLPRRLENGDVLDVSRLSDEDLARLFNRKPE